MKKEYKKAAVAFVDILGFKNMVDASENDKDEFDNIYSALEVMKYRKKKNRKIERQDGIRVSIFSDSIVISHSGSPIIIVLEDLIEDVMYLQNDLLKYNITCRGGISVGKIYHSKSKVFGPALVEAIQLEKHADYACIVIENNVFKKCAEYSGMEANDKQVQNIKDKYLRKDDNDKNILFVDYLHKLSALHHSYIKNFIQKSKEDNRDDDKVYKKYLQLENYFNTP